MRLLLVTRRCYEALLNSHSAEPAARHQNYTADDGRTPDSSDSPHRRHHAAVLRILAAWFSGARITAHHNQYTQKPIRCLAAKQETMLSYHRRHIAPLGGFAQSK